MLHLSSTLRVCQRATSSGNSRPTSTFTHPLRWRKGLVYLTTGDRRILALDAESGELIWEYRANDPVHSSPAVAGDLVFFGLQDGRVIALNRTGGQSEWEFMTEGPVVSSPVVRDGVLYIASGDERLYALDALTGREYWSYVSNGWIGSSPAVFDGVIAVTSYDTKLHIIDMDIGRKRLDFFVSIRPQASPSFGGKYLFVSNASDRLNAIDWRKKHLPFEKAAMRLRVQLFNWGMVGSVPPEKGYVWSLLEDNGIHQHPGSPPGAGSMPPLRGASSSQSTRNQERSCGNSTAVAASKHLRRW